MFMSLQESYVFGINLATCTYLRFTDLRLKNIEFLVKLISSSFLTQYNKIFKNFLEKNASHILQGDIQVEAIFAQPNRKGD